MSTNELITLQEALIWVFGPIIFKLALPLLFALGAVAAILAGITALFQHRRHRIK